MNKEKQDAIFNLILYNNESHRFWISDTERERLEKGIKKQTEILYSYWLSDADIEQEIDIFMESYLD